MTQPTAPDLEADYVIVGAGAAGCVLAERLSASGEARVLVLEAGGADRHPAIKVPAGFRYTVDNPRLNWGYRTAPGGHIGARAIDFPRGRVLGGSSSINGHAVRARPGRRLRPLGTARRRGWTWDDVLPLFPHEPRAGTRRSSNRGSTDRSVAD